jgi:hypothetical protein
MLKSRSSSDPSVDGRWHKCFKFFEDTVPPLQCTLQPRLSGSDDATDTDDEMGTGSWVVH